MYEFSKAKEDSPTRCQAVNAIGQCLNESVPGTKYCGAHGGQSQARANELKVIRNLKLARWQAEVEEKSRAPGLKDLREEIAVLRLTLESVINTCNSTVDLVTQSHRISRLVTDINVLVTSCHKLDSSLGGLLDRKAILDLGSKVMEIISARLPGHEALGAIADDIIREIGQCGLES